MKWSWKIGEFAGIGLYIHATFPLLLVFAAAPTLFYGGDLSAALENVAFILILFVCVVLHEYGHALTARRFGIQTQDITLLPIGGVARLTRMPDQPLQELLIAAAGPLVNVVIAALLFVGVLLFSGRALTFGLEQPSFLGSLMTLNVVLVLFNLIPAFPMDGGRILRALLATQIEHGQATRYAAYLGQGIAVLFGIAGFFFNPLLIVTALFIFMGAGAESQLAQNKSKMAGLTAGQAMRTNIRALSSYDWLSTAVDQMRATGQQDFPIVENGRVVGMLSREALTTGLQHFGPYTPIRNVMRADATTVEVEQPLAAASETMQQNDWRAVPVTQHGTLVGLLTFESIRDFLNMQKILRFNQNPHELRS